MLWPLAVEILRQVNTLQVCSYFCLILISFFSPQILVRMSLKLTRRFLLVCIETAEYSLNDCCSNSFLNPLLSDFDKTISKCYLCLFDRNSSFQPCFFFFWKTNKTFEMYVKFVLKDICLRIHMTTKNQPGFHIIMVWNH